MIEVYEVFVLLKTDLFVTRYTIRYESLTWKSLTLRH